MFNKRNLVLLLFACAVTLMLGGCGAGAVRVPASEVEPIPEFSPGPLAALDTEWAGLRNFSSEMFNAVLAEGEANPVISPLSAYFALAMAALGAGGETAREFAEVLGREPLELAQELASLAARLTSTQGQTVITIANSIWLNDDFTVAADFNHTARRYFGAPARARDFSRRSTVDEINAWIYEQTNGLIGEVLREIDDDTVMFLINTLYLLARWQARMREETRDFHPAAGAPVTVPFVRRDFSSLNVLVTDNFQAALLPYDDRRTGFFLLMPTDGSCIRDFARRYCMGEVFSNLQSREDVDLHMPELSKNFDINLNDILIGMGLELAFEENFAEFPDLIEDNIPLFISKVRQVVRLELDRYGTEAAAVTVVEFRAVSALPPRDPLYLIFDRPFLYGIFDLDTGLKFFMGAVDNPAL